MLTEEQVAIIKHTWNLMEHRKNEVGSLTFIHLFQSHPQVKDRFKEFQNFHDLEELADSEIFRNHASRVMNVLHRVRIEFLM